MIDFERKIIFFPYPKCASSTIRDQLRRQSKKCGEIHDWFSWAEINKTSDENKIAYKWKEMVPSLETTFALLKKHGHNPDDFTKFTIVRNPYNLMVSAWLYASQKQDFRGSFPEWVDIIYANKKLDKLPFRRGQMYYYCWTLDEVCSVENLHKITFVKMEELKTNEFIKEKFNGLPFLNKSVSQRDYMSYYTTELLEKVNEMYHQHFERFDYKKIENIN